MRKIKCTYPPRGGMRLKLAIGIVLAGLIGFGILLAIRRSRPPTSPASERSPSAPAPAAQRTPLLTPGLQPVATKPKPSASPVAPAGRAQEPPAAPNGMPSLLIGDTDEPAAIEAQVRDFLRKNRRQTTQDAVRAARQLLSADSPLLRSAGGMLLTELGAMDDASLRAVAGDRDAAVALNVLGYLTDLGKTAEANSLKEFLGAATKNPDALTELLAGGELLDTGKRAVLDLLSQCLPKEAAQAVYTELMADADQPHDVRMKSALLLQDSMEFDAYRRQIKSMADTASDATWAESCKRLSEQLQGPAEMHQGIPELTVDGVDERLSRPYDAMLQDLALYIDQVLGAPEHRVEKGSADNLTGYFDDFSKKPLSSEEQAALSRLQVQAARIRAEELK